MWLGLLVQASPAVAKRLTAGVASVTGNSYAFAALKEAGEVVTWGAPGSGGDSSAVAERLAAFLGQASPRTLYLHRPDSPFLPRSARWPTVTGRGPGPRNPGAPGA